MRYVEQGINKDLVYFIRFLITWIYMAYKALYRKYRPETFENVVGQKHIIKTLLNAVENICVCNFIIFNSI